MRITEIDWNKAKFITSGSYGVVYQVAPLRVVKISFRITLNEVKAQRYFAARHDALRVLDYVQGLRLPEHIHQAVCTIHGDTGGWGNCICKEPVDAMLMPKAQTPVPPSPQLTWFMDMRAEECQEKLHRRWDRKPNNVALHHGHFVALDFGDPES
jgi:hypothetical protein